MLRQNPAKAPAILAAFIHSLEQSSPRRAELVKKNQQEFLAFIQQELRSDEWEPEIPKKLGQKAPMFAADDKTYQTALIAVFTRLDGTGPVLASNVPSGDVALPVGGSTPNYPVVFQARGLQAGSEQEKIALIAKKLNPVRLLACHSDPTLGPPVVWPLSNGRDWRYPVLAGNSRTVAILSAPKDRYAAYEKAIRATPEGRGLKRTPKDMRLILLRAVIGVNGKGPLTENQAGKLAAVSQASTAGEESAIGRAISVMRSLGIRDVQSLPPLSKPWGEAIHRDNVKEFTNENSAFWIELLNRLGPIQRATYERDEGKAAEMLVNIFIGFLPEEIAQAGFGDRKTEAALVAAMPALVSLHQEVIRGEVKPKWDLYARLPKIMNVYRILRRKRLSVDKAVKLAEEEALQVKLGSVQTALGEAIEDPLSFVAAVMFYKLSQRLSPGETIKQWMTPYVEAAVEDSAKIGETGGNMFAVQGGYDTDPAQTLANIISMRLPRVRRNRRKGKPMYSRPRPRRRNPDKAQEILDNFIAMLDKKLPRKAGIVRRNKQMFLDFIRSELAKPAKPEYIDLDPGETLDPGIPTLVEREPYEALQKKHEERAAKYDAKDLQKRLARKRGVLPDWTPSVAEDGVTVVWTAPSGLARVKDKGLAKSPIRFSAEGLYPDGWALVDKGPLIGSVFKAAKAEERAALREKRLAEKSQPKSTPQVMEGLTLEPPTPDVVDPSQWDILGTFQDGEITAYYKEFDETWNVTTADTESGHRLIDAIRLPKDRFPRLFPDVIQALKAKLGPIDRASPKPEPLVFSTKRVSAMTERQARNWVVNAAEFMASMPSVAAAANYDPITREGDGVGLAPMTDGPIRSFLIAHHENVELPTDYYLAAAEYLRLHKDTQLDESEWREAFNALQNVVGVEAEDTRLLLKADVESVGKNKATTSEGWWHEEVTPQGNTIIIVKAGRKQKLRLSNKVLEKAGLVNYEDYKWAPDRDFALLVQPDALDKFLAVIEEHWPTLAATMRPYAAQVEEVDRDTIPVEEEEYRIDTVPIEIFPENFVLFMDVGKVGFRANVFSQELGDIPYWQKRGDGNFWVKIPLDSVEDLEALLSEKQGSDWEVIKRTFEKHRPEISRHVASLKQNREEGFAGGGTWKFKNPYVQVSTYFLSKDDRNKIKSIRGVGEKVYAYGAVYPVRFFAKPDYIPALSDALRPHFPRLAEALSRAYGGIARIMDEEGERCAPLMELSDKLTPEDVRNPAAQAAIAEVLAAFLERGPTNGYMPYPYQVNGIAFAKLGGYRVVIGDAMGLGKTIQGLGAIITDPNENLPALVVGPKNVLYAAWLREARIWLEQIVPRDQIIVVEKDADLPRKGFKGMVIVSWEFIAKTPGKGAKTLVRLPRLEEIGFKLLIADEAHYMKSGTANRARALIELAMVTPHVLLLTGTPVKNVVSDLWALLKAVQPEIWGSKAEFKRAYAEVLDNQYETEVGINEDMIDDLRARLACTMIRRLKQDALPDLPPMTRQPLVIDITPQERQELNFLHEKFEAWLREEIRARIAKALEEQGIDYRSLSQEGHRRVMNQIHEKVDRSLKAEVLRKIGEERMLVGKIKAKRVRALMEATKRQGEPAIFWADHKVVIRELARSAESLGLRFGVIDGGTKGQERGEIVEDFQNGKLDIVIASSSGKEGLTMTKANRAYFVERYWTPADEAQAEARIWRIGQTRPSTNYFLEVPNSIDQYMDQLIQRKRSLIDDVIGDEDIEKKERLSAQSDLASMFLKRANPW